MTPGERTKAMLDKWWGSLDRPDRCEMAGDDYDRLASMIVTAIAEAEQATTVAERNRCARLAEKMGNEVGGGGDCAQGYQGIAEDIAAAIRKGTGA